MNYAIRPFCLVAILSVVALLSSCVSRPTAMLRPLPVGFTATVIESSTDRELNLEEMNQLRAGAAEYLRSEGKIGPGDYYVRVNLTPNLPDAEGEWAIVRLSSEEQPTYAMVESYPRNGYDEGAADDSAEEYPDFRTYSTSYGYYNPYDYYYPGYHQPVRPWHRGGHHPPGKNDPNDDGDDHDHDRDHHNGEDHNGGQDGHHHHDHDSDHPGDRGDGHGHPPPVPQRGNGSANPGNNGTPGRTSSPGDYGRTGRPGGNPQANPVPASTPPRPAFVDHGGHSPTPSPIPASTGRGSSPPPPPRTFSPPPARSAPAPAPSSDSSRSTRDSKNNDSRDGR